MDTMSEEMLELFRFNPTDREAIEKILTPKIIANDKKVRFIVEIELNKHEPWDLPQFSMIKSDQEWFFFTQPYPKHKNGNRKDRTTTAGYWKSTGNDQEIYSGESLIGMKKILVFHIGRTSKGEGTCWVMHEYRTTQEYDGTKPGQKAFVLCRLFKKKEMKKKSKSALAHVSRALEVQAQTHITSNPSCDAEVSDATPDPEQQRYSDIFYEKQFEPQFEPQDDVSEFPESVPCNPEERSYNEFDNQNNLAYDGQTLMKTKEVIKLLQSEEIINRKPHLQMETIPLQNPVSSGGGAEQIYDSSLKESNNHLSAFASGEVRNESMTQMAQGTAPRRSLLQRKHQVRPLTTSLMSEDCSYTTEDHELKPVATEEEKASEKHAVASGHGAAASALSEHRKILSDSPENCKTPQEPNTSMRPSLKLQGNILTGINFGSLFSKAPPVRHSNWPLALLFRVVVIAVLFIIFASIWKCLKF